MIPKFRAWNKKTDSICKELDYTFITMDNRIIESWINGKIKDVTDIYEVMLSTGLFDKNGVEIFEGDIIFNHRDSKKAKQTICWFRGGFMLKTQGHFGYSSIEIHDKDSERYYEVIGNIYETPEILEGEKE